MNIYNTFFDQFKTDKVTTVPNVSLVNYAETIRRIEQQTGVRVPENIKEKIKGITEPITEFLTIPGDGSGAVPLEFEALRVLMDSAYLGRILNLESDSKVLMEDSLNQIKAAGVKMNDLLKRLQNSGAINTLYSGGYMTQEEFYFLENITSMADKAICDYVLFSSTAGLVSRELNNSSALMSKVYNIVTKSPYADPELLRLVGVQNTAATSIPMPGGAIPNLGGGPVSAGGGMSPAMLMATAGNQQPQQQQPVYGQPPVYPQQPAYANNQPPVYGQQPVYPQQPQPVYGQPPVYGTPPQLPPIYNNNNQQPVYANNQRSIYGQPPVYPQQPQPVYGAPPQLPPIYSNNQPPVYGQQPVYGTPPQLPPIYNNQQPPVYPQAQSIYGQPIYNNNQAPVYYPTVDVYTQEVKPVNIY